MVKNSVSYAFWKGRLANYIQEFKKTTETSDEYDDRDKFCLQLIGKYYRYRVDNSARFFFHVDGCEQAISCGAAGAAKPHELGGRTKFDLQYA